MEDGIKDKILMSIVTGVGTPAFGYVYALGKKSKQLNGGHFDVSAESLEAAKMGLNAKAVGKLAVAVGGVTFVSLLLSERLQKGDEEKSISR